MRSAYEWTIGRLANASLWTAVALAAVLAAGCGDNGNDNFLDNDNLFDNDNIFDNDNLLGTDASPTPAGGAPTPAPTPAASPSPAT